MLCFPYDDYDGVDSISVAVESTGQGSTGEMVYDNDAERSCEDYKGCDTPGVVSES